jgi:hypothetical protein
VQHSKSAIWMSALGQERPNLPFRAMSAVPPIASAEATGRPVAKCHVWTAPAVQGESDVQRSDRVQPCIRPLDAVAMAAGPDVIRGSGPNQNHAFLPRMARERVFPIDGLDRFASMSSSPLQFLKELTQHLSGCRKPSRSTGLTAHQQRPGDTGHFVGKRNRDNLERSPREKPRHPRISRWIELGAAQGRDRADHEDAPQVAVALFGYRPEF